MNMIKERFLLSKPLQKIKRVHTCIYIYDRMIKSECSLHSMYRNVYFRLGLFSMVNRKTGAIEEIDKVMNSIEKI